MCRSKPGLEKAIARLRKSEVADAVGARLSSFSSFRKKGNNEWFSELCFCILTANSRARSAIEIQEKLGHKGFTKSCLADISRCIRESRHRFHNSKARYIIEARKSIKIKSIIQAIAESSQLEARNWLVGNIKGLGMKEASHFLRNVGYFGLAILDRHILRLMHEHRIIGDVPKSLTKKRYLEIEKKFLELSESMGMSAAELDLYMWYMNTGEVLK